MASLDIVNLIEQNPITRLSNTYHNRFLSKIKSKFVDAEQQLFATNFYTYFNHNANSDFIIDVDKIWKWVGFAQKVKAKQLLERHFTKNRDYVVVLGSNLNTDADAPKRGGHNRETIMMTTNTFKRFCLKAETKKADEIHNYYITLEDTLYEIMNEESSELRQQLENIKNEIVKKDQTSQETIQKLKKEKELERQNILLREFGNAGPLIYIVKVKSYENGEYVIKIGQSSRGVSARYAEHKTRYDEALLMDCFLVKQSKDFESFLHKHRDIKPNQVKTLPNHETENELFLIGKNLTYAIVSNIIKSNINQYNDIDTERIYEELNTIKLILQQRRNVSSEFVSDSDSESNSLPIPVEHNEISSNVNTTHIVQTVQVEELLNKIAKLEQSNKEIMDKLNAVQTRTTTNFNTPLDQDYRK
jgi:hypothetical protein